MGAIADLYAELQVLDATIEGIRTAYGYGPTNMPPGTLAAADLPCTINLPPKLGVRLTNQTQRDQFLIVEKYLYVKPVQLGIALEGAAAVFPFFAAVLNTYEQTDLRNVLTMVRSHFLNPTNQAGLPDDPAEQKVLDWGGNSYHGIRFAHHIMLRQIAGIGS